jgi:hypothetical protein
MAFFLNMCSSVISSQIFTGKLHKILTQCNSSNEITKLKIFLRILQLLAQLSKDKPKTLLSSRPRLVTVTSKTISKYAVHGSGVPTKKKYLMLVRSQVLLKSRCHQPKISFSSLRLNSLVTCKFLTRKRKCVKST